MAIFRSLIWLSNVASIEVIKQNLNAVFLDVWGLFSVIVHPLQEKDGCENCAPHIYSTR